MPIKKTLKKRTTKTKKLTTQKKFEGIFRGSILGTAINKHVQYISFADRRSQGLITINAILLPLSLSGIQDPILQAGAAVAALTAIITIAGAIISLYPQKYKHRHSTRHRDLLHFREIASMSEAEYVAEMMTATKDPTQLTEMMVHDLYHLSRMIVTPKFDMLKRCYFIFLIGYSAALLIILNAVWEFI